jgi:hypothetical protein
MQTHVKRNSLLAAALSLTCHGALAQSAPAPAPAAPAPAAQPAPRSSGLNDATGVDSSTADALKAFYTEKPADGTAAKTAADVAGQVENKVMAIDVLNTPGLDNPETRARFETYLSLPAVSDDRIKSYFGLMDQITDTLKNGDTVAAWKMLSPLSQYQDLDAGISSELAVRIVNFWNTDRTKGKLDVADAQLKNNAADASHNISVDAGDIEQAQEEHAAKMPKGSSGSSSDGVSNSNTTNSPLMNVNADPAAAEAAVEPMISSGTYNKIDMTGEYLNLLEARAKIKLNEIRENRMDDQDRQDFSDYIRTLYNSHRYYHVILAAAFYRALFNEGDYPSDLANQAVAGVSGNARTGVEGANQIQKNLGVNGQGPLNALNHFGSAMGGDPIGENSQANQPVTIADEVTSALEINQRVSQAIDVFKYKAGEGEIFAASQELQEAFVGNEYHPALQGLPRDQKEKVGDLVAKLGILKNEIEVRAFEQVDATVAAIQKIASDFDATKPLALVNDIKLESRLRLGKAAMLVQAKDMPDAMTEFQTAAEEWPGNPDLTADSNRVFSASTEQSQGTADFDRMAQSEDYRGIFAHQLEFALAVHGDATREQQLKDALLKVQKAEMASEKANMQVMNGDVNGAWETIQLAAKDWPDDMKLNKLLASLSERSASFVSDLDKAQDAEAKKQYGYSLTWYVNAQSIYPPSVIANEGIDRISKMILSPQSAALPSVSSN